VATFCHQLNHQETPKIDTDATLNLVYVGELTNHFIKIIEDVYKVQFEAKNSIQEIGIKSTTRLKVSRLLKILESFKEGYYSCGEIPDLNSTARLNLWNTFLCYVDLQNFFPYHLKLNTDHRGSFVETIKLKSGGQVSFSTTDPGITRGNHFHTHKAERFAVIKGKARIELRRIGTDKVHCFELNGTNPSFVDMPIWHTHNITNIGKEELYTIFWINEKFNPDDPDTYFEIV
jgi:UDP-2-acetamido-2,6-beta-L-arabino-hexul-4-ose reductase